jgi:hypothetical protein
MNSILNTIRSEMKVARQRMHPGDMLDYYWGRFTGLSLAIGLLSDIAAPPGSITSRCPDCRAFLGLAGLCCDACGWVAASDGQKRAT